MEKISLSGVWSFSTTKTLMMHLSVLKFRFLEVGNLSLSLLTVTSVCIIIKYESAEKKKSIYIIFNATFSTKRMFRFDTIQFLNR